MADTEERVTVISDRITNLRQLRENAIRDIEFMVESLTMQEMRLAEIEAQLGLLYELDDSCGDRNHVRSYRVSVNGNGECICNFDTTVTNGRMKPSDAVVSLLKKRPGLRLHQILDTLQFSVDSSAKDRRHTLRNTILNLSKAGRLRRLDNDTYRVVEAEP